MIKYRFKSTDDYEVLKIENHLNVKGLIARYLPILTYLSVCNKH